jgi:hypothetical protein
MISGSGPSCEVEARSRQWFVQEYKLKGSAIVEASDPLPVGSASTPTQAMVESVVGVMEEHSRTRTGVLGVRLIDEDGDVYFKWDIEDVLSPPLTKL